MSDMDMAKEAYTETVSEAMERGLDKNTAHKEGITAAAMTLAAMAGIEDAAARQQVESLELAP